jgi:hypothetical protein
MKCALKKGELIKVELCSGGNLLRCLSGALWITTGNGVDYLLTEYGSSGNMTGKHALVEALEDSELQIDNLTAMIPSVGQLSPGGFRFMAEA